MSGCNLSLITFSLKFHQDRAGIISFKLVGDNYLATFIVCHSGNCCVTYSAGADYDSEVLRDTAPGITDLGFQFAHCFGHVFTLVSDIDG